MLVNVDKTIKNNLLQMYKQEAEDFLKFKKEAREKRIKEEREYLQQLSKQETAIEDKCRLDQLRRLTKRQEGYSDHYSNQCSKRFKSRIEDGRINYYGHNISGSSPTLSQLKHNHSLPDINPNHQMELKERDMVRKEDNMANYLTDIPNENQLKQYYINRRNNQMSYYKSVLDAQCSQIEPITSIPACAYINNPIIIQQYRRNQLANNPYCKRKNNSIGLSTMERNIILNPDNNLCYNKYFNFIKQPGKKNDTVVHNWNNYNFANHERSRTNNSSDNHNTNFYQNMKESSNLSVFKDNNTVVNNNDYLGSSNYDGQPNRNSNNYRPGNHTNYSNVIL